MCVRTKSSMSSASSSQSSQSSQSPARSTASSVFSGPATDTLPASPTSSSSESARPPASPPDSNPSTETGEGTPTLSRLSFPRSCVGEANQCESTRRHQGETLEESMSHGCYGAKITRHAAWRQASRVRRVGMRHTCPTERPSLCSPCRPEDEPSDALSLIHI